MSDNLSIEKNVRIPFKNNQKFYELMEKMDFGDSILFNTAKEANSLRACLRRNGFRTAIRKEGANLRVWKLKKSEKKSETASE